MALRDRAVKALRNVFGAPQEERAKADSPSVAAMRHHVPSMFTVWGREDIGGLLTVSQSLMDRFADYEAMEEYPDINSAFHYFANDATQPSVKDGRCIWVMSEDDALKGLGNDLMHRILRVEDEIWPQAYGLGMMGNDYLELLITENGIVGTNTLPVPTMRRVERLDGGLIGFVQDVTGQFTANSQELRRMLAGNVEIPRSLALFEDWQVAHFRLRATRRRSPYGVSVAEGARWIWKRLVMLEDSVLIYKLCLRGDSQIWTPDGRKAIKDLQEGDEVYSYTDPGNDHRLKKTKVVYKKHNGQDKIFRVFSDHREIFANRTHPVLVETVVGRGKGIPQIRRLDYVEVQNLEPGVHRFVTPSKNEDDWEEIYLERPQLHSKARLVGAVERTMPYPKIAKQVGVHHCRARDFFAGDYDLKTDTAVALLEANGHGPEHLEIEEHWGGERGTPVTGITVPETADADFARWWGFMLGDGFVATRTHKLRPGHSEAHVAQNETGFALGAHQDINEQYKALFEKYAPVKLVGDTGHRLGAYTIVSGKFAEFMTLNGFVPGAHHKRLPEWIFRAHPKLKLAMIRGLADADAHIKPRKEGRKTRYERARFEMCNKQLLEDVRELAMQLGLVATFVWSRTRAGGRTIKGSSKPLPTSTSYCLDVSFKPQAKTEVIRGVEEIETDDIYDIGVEADEHNFVADGCVVHNTRAPARYAYYIDTTDIPSDQVGAFLQKAKRDLKKKRMVNPRSGRLDLRYNPLARDEDFFIAVREGRELARVDVLSGPDYQAVDDVEYFKQMLHATLKVPRAYLGKDEAPPSKSILSNDDVRAARVTLNLQRELKIGWERVIRTHLAARGVRDPWKPEFTIEMTVPSGIWELAAYETMNAAADYASRIQPWVSTRWIQENILKFSEEEIKEIEKQQKKDSEEEQAGDLPSYAMGGGQGGPPEAPPPGGEEEPEEAPPEEAPEKAPPEEEEGTPKPAPKPSPKPKAPAVGKGKKPTPEEWKRYDYERRLEEWKYRESSRRHSEISDKLNRLLEGDKGFARREHERRAFFEEVRGLLRRTNGGSMSAPPSGKFSRKELLAMTRRFHGQ